MNSSVSTTCVQLASLLSRTPYCAEIARPEPQMPLKPASRAMRAEMPLCASIRNSSSLLVSIWRSRALRDRVETKEGSRAFIVWLLGRPELALQRFMQSRPLQLRQDFFSCSRNVVGKIDFNPGQAGDIGRIECVAAFEQQVAHGFFVRQVRAAAIDIAGDDLREAPRSGLG